MVDYLLFCNVYNSKQIFSSQVCLLLFIEISTMWYAQDDEN
jgi:hypothetical protein